MRAKGAVEEICTPKEDTEIWELIQNCVKGSDQWRQWETNFIFKYRSIYQGMECPSRAVRYCGKSIRTRANLFPFDPQPCPKTGFRQQ